jgi:hypothetical protein
MHGCATSFSPSLDEVQGPDQSPRTCPRVSLKAKMIVGHEAEADPQQPVGRDLRSHDVAGVARLLTLPAPPLTCPGRRAAKIVVS